MFAVEPVSTDDDRIKKKTKTKQKTKQLSGFMLDTDQAIVLVALQCKW